MHGTCGNENEISIICGKLAVILPESLIPAV
jgi:hypothetical protein